MNWLQKIARPADAFLGDKIIAFRSVDIDRSEDALLNGFKKNQFLTTDQERAMFYAHFTSWKYPGIIFECSIDSSRSYTDMNDATTEQQQEAYETVTGVAYEISDLLSRQNIDIPEYELEHFIGNQMGSDIGGYYDNYSGTSSLWIFVSQKSDINPSEVQSIVPPGRYGGWITLDNRGVFGIDADVSSLQLQYSNFVTPQNIIAAYIHTSLLSLLGWNWKTYPNGSPENGMNDNVSIIPGNLEGFLEEIERQSEICQDEEVCSYMEDLLSEIEENTGYDSEMNSSIIIPGAVFAKLRSKEPLKVEDFESSEGFVRFELPAERMRVLYAIRKGKSI